MGGGVESDYSVCPCPLRWFYACFTPVYVGRDGLSGTPVYIGIRRCTLVGSDVELDNNLKGQNVCRHSLKTNHAIKSIFCILYRVTHKRLAILAPHIPLNVYLFTNCTIFLKSILFIFGKKASKKGSNIKCVYTC